ncbi:hypothetical protein FisN_10Lu330 [Fistulifera solaris]|uniref:Uncharacterized protein n=1 Tax=Fistulifera solaris TaxID=1519565 RepID=A0A1Z5KG61_FISSO|nr:hypothetical protein FisN_10Lu330 [Fistulifera solaris]|eukprot:GAX25115.1 hypothetical protein FisN_10Lu330 [Fistulifera solaris]
MQNSERSISSLSPQSHEDSSCKRQRTTSPEQSFSAVVQPPVGPSQDYDLSIDCDDFFANRVRPDDLSEFPPSLIEEADEVRPSSKKPVSILRMKHRHAWRPQASLVSTAPLSAVVAGSDADTTSYPCSHSRSVTFTPQIVKGIKEIPNRYSLTKEEKDSMYCDPRTLNLEGDKRFVEREFENSRFCLDNVVEEDEFFRTHLGELTHPAQLRAYMFNVFKHLPDDTPITGCSREEYLACMKKYTADWHSAIAEGRFHPDMAAKAIQAVEAKRLRRRHRRAAKSKS